MTSGNNTTLHYPRPPFVEQPQQMPGLASEMKPLPDHGETSYIGSGKLAGKKALITGGEFRNWSGGGHCLCQRRRRCCHWLFTARRIRCRSGQSP